MKWLEISVKVSPDACEAVAELLDRYGQGGAVIETIPPQLDSQQHGPFMIQVKAYLPADRNASKRRKAVEAGLVHLRKLHPISQAEIRELAETDWTEAWEKGYQPQKIGEWLIIAPTWRKYIPKERRDLGAPRPRDGLWHGASSHHTSLFNCFRALSPQRGPFLDVGTGSGIQAIAAVNLGASHVTALDIEEMAVNVARQNVSLNDVSDRVELYTGMLKEFQSQIQPAHLIVVNILAYTIIKMLPELKEKLLPKGYLIAGGILSELAGEFLNAVAAEELTLVQHLIEEDWITIVAQSQI